MDSLPSPLIAVKRRTASAAKYGFLLVAFIFIGVLVGYAFAFVKIGPADRVQEIGYVVLFAVTSGLLLISLVAFFIVLVGYGGNRFVGGIYISLVFLLLGSMISAAMFNWAPDARSTSKHLRNSLRKTGKPSQFIEYVQRHGHCCGAYGLSDYKSSEDSYFPLPASCCSSQSCIKNASLATQGCLLRIHGRWNFVYGRNNPTLRKYLLSIELCPILLSFFTTAILLLFSYFHCWRMIFPESIPKVVVIVSQTAFPKELKPSSVSVVPFDDTTPIELSPSPTPYA